MLEIKTTIIEINNTLDSFINRFRHMRQELVNLKVNQCKLPKQTQNSRAFNNAGHY